MRAVNLIPGDVRSGHGRGARNSGASVYLLLAGLAALVVCAGLWATANKQAGDRVVKLAGVQAQAAAAEKRAVASAPYVEFERLATDRVQTVKTLSQTRFDWAHAMREVSRVLPADVWLTGLSGVSGAGSDSPGPTTSAAPAPSITLDGCTRSQAKVAGLMARLRAIDGIRGIALKNSEKPDAAGDASCPANRPSDPRFTIAISFAVPDAPRDQVDDMGQVMAPGATPAVAGTGSRSAQNAAAVASVAASQDG
jgi:Tfp pilus assembly protein PilN